MFRNHILLTGSVFFIAVIFAVSCNSSKHTKIKRLPGAWQSQPITIDGSNKDWPSPYPEYDEKAMLGYAVSNDKENLYITVETGDLATQLKILRNGLTVWIDRKGEQNELTAINFPIPQEPQGKGSENEGRNPEGGRRPKAMHIQQPQGGGSDKPRLDLEDKVRSAMIDANEYSLQGFKSCNLQYPITEKDTCGIIVRIGIDADNELVWEAVVPFRSFYFKSEIVRSDKGRPLSICFETTGSKRPPEQRDAGSSQGGGMRPGIGFGIGGMGMGMQTGPRGGSRSGPGNADIMESLYKSTKTYKQFGIAFQ